MVKELKLIVRIYGEHNIKFPPFFRTRSLIMCLGVAVVI